MWHRKAEFQLGGFNVSPLLCKKTQNRPGFEIPHSAVAPDSGINSWTWVHNYKPSPAHSLHTANKVFSSRRIKGNAIIQHWLFKSVTDKKQNKCMRQQACKTHTPPYGLKQRRRPKFPMPTDPHKHRWQPHDWRPPIPPRADDLCRRPRDSPRAKLHQRGEDLPGQ